MLNDFCRLVLKGTGSVSGLTVKTILFITALTAIMYITVRVTRYPENKFRINECLSR